MSAKKINKSAKKGRPKRAKSAPNGHSPLNEIMVVRAPRPHDFDENAKVGSYISFSVVNPEADWMHKQLHEFHTIPGDTVIAFAGAEGERIQGMIVQFSSALDPADAVLSGEYEQFVKDTHNGVFRWPVDQESSD